MLNQYKKKLYLAVLAKNLLMLLVLALVFIFFYQKDEQRPVVLPTIPEYEILSSEVLEEASVPKNLLIPSIEINTNVQSVGVTETGNMAVPEGYSDVGWFRFGASPGTSGSAVLAGHLDTGSGKPAVFYRLGELKIGDEVFVTNEEGETLKFTVSGTRLVDYSNPPTELLAEIFGKPEGGGESRLVLITCDGVWLPEKKTYDTRLIVFADFVGTIQQE